MMASGNQSNDGTPNNTPRLIGVGEGYKIPIYRNDAVINEVDNRGQVFDVRQFGQSSTHHLAGYITASVTTHTIGDNPQAQIGTIQEGIFV
jgi:hypothetical protein